VEKTAELRDKRMWPDHSVSEKRRKEKELKMDKSHERKWARCGMTVSRFIHKIGQTGIKSRKNGVTQERTFATKRGGGGSRKTPRGKRAVTQVALTGISVRLSWLKGEVEGKLGSVKEAQARGRGREGAPEGFSIFENK